MKPSSCNSVRLAGLRWSAGMALALGVSGCVEKVEIVLSNTGSADGGGANGTGGAHRGEAGAGGADVGLTGRLTSVAAGGDSTCAIVDGRLYAWGSNASGQLGVPGSASRNRPVRVGGAEDWTSCDVGEAFMCAIRGGEVYCWGEGAEGQLGHGKFEARNMPGLVELAGPATSIETGFEFACALLADGSLWCWGQNEEGQLAQGDPFPAAGVDRATPQQVASGVVHLQVSGGQGHTCAIRSDGSLWCWGRNDRNHLGLGDAAPEQVRTPQRVGTATDWAMVAAGQQHTCAARTDGTVWCWGDDGLGVLGTGDGLSHALPRQLTGLSDVVSITSSVFHNCVTTGGAQAYCWGRNVEGQLGLMDNDDRDTPALVGPYSLIDVGSFHTCALSAEDVRLRCTGSNESGRLGVGDTERRREFTPVASP